MESAPPPPIAITFAPRSGVLAPGADVTVTITLESPRTCHVAGHVVCTCPHLPAASVSIQGDVVRPHLALKRCTIPLGVAYVGRTVSATLDIANLTYLDTAYQVKPPTDPKIQAHVPSPDHVVPGCGAGQVVVEVVPTAEGIIRAWGCVFVNGGETVVGYEVSLDARDLAVAVGLVPPQQLAAA